MPVTSRKAVFGGPSFPPSGAALAALLRHPRRFAGKKGGLVLPGGHIAPPLLAQVIGLALADLLAGGEVAGAFDVADTVYAARVTKPLFAVANNDAFSAAYLRAAGAQRIYVSRTSGVGSVGVIVSHLDMSVSDEKMGYRYTIVSAGARKADFNPHAPLSDEALRYEAEADRRGGGA